LSRAGSKADTTNIAQSAVYASLDSTDPDRMVVIAINRTASAITTGIAVTHDRLFEFAEVYQLTGASSNPQKMSDIELQLTNAFQYTMPAYSVSTLVLHAVTTLPGDFDEDGDIDGRDFLAWQRNPSAGDLADWQANYGAGFLSASADEPEPGSLMILLLGTLLVKLRR
jgi:hypothetical protein